ncbi:CooT family nickel-binding protein [Candidatus Bathyarchaeota archaeon]|nr:CooT family nickel-binding protein [Candidatus Bathyarchaeota archaeon]NIU81617.1 CooT family nickel-binding protein [Candidatus Bathyarchaeota archaeon]NIV68262.1 CooT family nickel-binding protein [Candidatus Bathyarchaeota archaeon]NIW16603.1 CooT family nickel-binding protein [Candidatus Bathyarchaeota archaeon]NIW34803.1 CooT family nickel-binding protein [Candidatus Bathyarchaeota archaeon]
MCEFTVLLEGKEVFKDVVYVKENGGRVMLKDVLGESRTFEDCRIAEVDVSSERLVLSPTGAH